MNIRLLKDLDFASKINQTEAVTEAGKEMLKSYRGYMYSNAPTCGIVNGFIVEAKNFSFDTGLVSILNSVLDFVNENKISWKLASACESIAASNSNYSYIAKVGIETVGKLLEMKEQDVVSYIKAGSLKSVQYIPEFRAICKEVYNSTVSETRTPTYTITNPVSFVAITENKDQFFKVLGKTYKISEGKVEEAVYEDPTFVTVNKLLESFAHDGDNLYVEYKGSHGDVARFTIVESNEADAKATLEFTKGEVKETFESADAFREYANNASKVMAMYEKLNWMNAAEIVAKVFENAENIGVVDFVSIMNCTNGTVCAIIEGKENVNLTVFRSYNAGTSCNNYDYMTEALGQVKSLTGVDLKANYANRIDEDCKKQDPEAYKEIAEQLAAQKAELMAARKKKIAMLAEQFKNDPAKIALLNKAARDLAMLDE